VGAGVGLGVGDGVGYWKTPRKKHKINVMFSIKQINNEKYFWCWL